MAASTNTGNVIGSGSDSITLNMAEDQAQGTDAQFTVNVDGQQIGGVQTVTASQADGQTEAFTFLGDFGPGAHNVTVSFVNNFIYPGLSGDRNLYIDGVTYDGQSISNTTTPIYETALFPPNSTEGNVYGNTTFSVNDTTAVPAGTTPEQTTTPAPVSVGSGPDTLVLNMAEDPYQGDAQFTVSVDGKQIGGTQTTTAVVDQGQAQEFDIHGDFGSGSHTVSVDFLNDKIGDFYPGTQWAIDTTDRNLYVMGASLDGGTPASGAPWELSSDGSHDFTVVSGGNQSANAAAGLFASDGAAATSNNPAIPSGTLGTQTSMSFISSDTTGSSTASTTPTASTASSTSDPTSSSSGTSSGTSSGSTTSSDPTSSGSTTSSDPSSVSSAMASAVPSIQDVTGSTTPSAPGWWDQLASSGQSGCSSLWSTYQQQAGQVGGFAQHS
ncbi:MAG TPA: carbohydrate-binding domain-containing protein [Rhodopila sp.]|uniref:carbohydrate-binding domain-containing protein n=1 Tax=Rhodopila sp. TaxID=2480087 RepID=UPI002BD550EA|nr:carbohydrate-binding domain-containing protein [Rhodopila sp.]HVY13754.1 carbohydrate-binding domain-containing protein [Rhodopila sp.]